MEKAVGILGLGCYVPEKVLTNHDLEKIVETSDEWIVERTGIKNRHIAAEGEATSDMSVIAAERALVSEDSAGRWVLGSSMVPDRKQLASSLEPEHKITKHNGAKQNGEKATDKPPRASRFTPPTVGEVKVYCQERGSSVDPEKFVDFYSANGWKQGRNKPIVDWKAAVRTWERSDAQQKAQDKNRVRTTDEYRREADFFG